ncbi:MAG: alpha/beta hydrolase [Roseiflexaceae bacterium]
MAPGQYPRASPLDYLRLLIGTASAGLASLAMIEARSWPMVVLTLGVSEWGHVLAALALTPLLPGWRRTRVGRVGAAFGLLGAAFALVSLLRAARLARQLPELVAAAFGAARPRAAPHAPARPMPLVARDLLLGVPSPRVRHRRIPYATNAGQALDLDLHRSAVPATPAPCIVVIHGGSWANGDSTQLPGLNSYLAARGYAVAAINYRLAPTHRFPAARDDVLTAIEYLKNHAQELGIDPRRFVLLGRSAGAQLALLVAYTANDPAIRGVVDFYGPADLVYGYEHPARKRVLDSVGVIERFLGGSPTSAPETYAAASPIDQIGPDCPPTLLIHGGRDTLVAPIQSDRLAGRLAQARIQHMLLHLPWAEHGCDVNFSGPSGQISTYAIERFLAAVMTNDERRTTNDGRRTTNDE